MKATIYSCEQAAADGLELVKGGKYSQVLHDVVVAYQAARRSGSANTKSKAEVNLSGSKPWRQKGTGRARAGYKSSPVWVGGGVVFGPKPRDYSKNVTKQERRLAFKKALSVRIVEGGVFVAPSFDVAIPKTKEFLQRIPDDLKTGSLLVLSAGFSDATYLSARNVSEIHLKTVSEVNAEDILRFKKILLLSSGIGELVSRTK